MLFISRCLRAALTAVASAALIAAALPAPVPLGIGDPLFPHLGNPGYDVLAYDIGFAYRGSNNEPLSAVTRIDALATAPLQRVNLDFARGTVRSVIVNGARARFATAGQDLVVTPDRPVRAGGRLRITVRHTSDPRGAADGGWVRTADGLAMANQADAAHRIFPCNDHPADKAWFTFRVTAPRDVTVVANGLRTARMVHGRTTTWIYRTAHPMATELAQVSIGHSAVIHRAGPHRLPVRDVVPAKDRRKLEPWLRRTPGQLAWLESKAGRYPFETYGVLVADTSTGFELETQTLSLFERRLFTDPRFPKWYVESVMVHELAHQWFGDSVSPDRWADLWLNEGHATWYEALYADEHSGKSLAARMRAAYRDSDDMRAHDGPPAAPRPPRPGRKISIFRPVVYEGGALVLYALRQEIGADVFRRVERCWVREYRYRSATSADFSGLASRIAGRDLSGFFRGWLYGAKTPAMPGHPEWHSARPKAG